tara:strand:+ start:207 stop:398 length:192 start_codon:yes stop_codon:yes gene_type:complete
MVLFILFYFILFYFILFILHPILTLVRIHAIGAFLSIYAQLACINYIEPSWGNVADYGSRHIT